MDKKQIFFIVGILFSSTLACQEKYDPWGVWNNFPIDSNARVRTFTTGKYLESYGFGLYIVKECKDAVAGAPDFPAFATPGDYTRIERYEAIPEGFIFYLVGSGMRYTNGKPEVQSNTYFQIKMCFLNENECYFEYITREDANGFLPSEPFRENTIYKRFKVAVKQQY